MSKNTIFGEEHFIDTQMIKLVEQRNNVIDNYVFEQMENAIKGTLFVEMPKVEIDKEKLKKWVVLCSKLENIEHSELVDIATKKRIADLEAKLEQLQKEKELDNSFWKQECDSLQKALAEKDLRIEELEGQFGYECECNAQFVDCQKENEQLKQQLAEKDKIITKYQLLDDNYPRLEEKYDLLEGKYETLLEDNLKYEEQLAEKEKEIISLECVISEIHNDIKELHEFKVGEYEYDLTDSDARFSLECELLNKDQTKTDFAIEQLEKVKEFVFEQDIEITRLNKICDFIDQQIKELKEWK